MRAVSKLTLGLAIVFGLASMPVSAVASEATRHQVAPVNDGGGADTIHLVQRGESLWRIARRQLLHEGGSSRNRAVVARVLEIYADNRGLIGENPNRLRIGQRLVLRIRRVSTLGPAPTQAPGATECGVAASCAAGFTMNGVRYSLSCAAIRTDAVSDEVLGTGRTPYGREFEVRRVKDVDPALFVAANQPAGACAEGEHFRTDWQVALSPRPKDTDPRPLLDAICLVGDLSAAQSQTNGC